MASPVERLRKIWTPGNEVVEAIHELSPRTELDSMLRDFLHRAIQQKGPMQLILESNGKPVMNTGTLRFEIAHLAPTESIIGDRVVALWVEE